MIKESADEPLTNGETQLAPAITMDAPSAVEESSTLEDSTILDTSKPEEALLDTAPALDESQIAVAEDQVASIISETAEEPVVQAEAEVKEDLAPLVASQQSTISLLVSEKSSLASQLQESETRLSELEDQLEDQLDKLGALERLRNDVDRLTKEVGEGKAGVELAAKQESERVERIRTLVSAATFNYPCGIQRIG